MPGPMLAVVLAESPRQGVRAGPLVVLGHALLELVLLAALVIGLGSVLERPGVQTALALVGGAMLLWTAAGAFRFVAQNRAGLDWRRDDRPSGRWRTVFAGVWSSLANPYWTIWWATIGLSLLTKAYVLGVAGLAAFYVGHILGDLTWFTAVSGAIAAGRRFITPRVYTVMLAISAVLLLVMAVWFLVSGLRGLG